MLLETIGRREPLAIGNQPPGQVSSTTVMMKDGEKVMLSNRGDQDQSLKYRRTYLDIIYHSLTVPGSWFWNQTAEAI